MIKVGIIGYGYWGPNLVRNFSQIDGVEVVAVSDLRPERLDEARKRYPNIRITTNALELIGHMDVDVVAIATPVSTHFDLAIRALNHKKHVFVEKPICDTSEKTQQLINTAKEHGLTLMVDHTFLYTGAVHKMKQLIEDGELGDIYYYDSVRINLGLFQHDVDVIWDLAVHDLSILDYLFDKKPTRVSATGIQHIENQPTNMAYVTLGFEDNQIAHLHVNWLSPIKVRRTLIGGSKKMLVYDDLEPSEKIRIYDRGVEVLNELPEEDQKSVQNMLSYRRTGDMIAPKLVVTEALELETQHFIRCCRGLEKPLTDAESGLRVVKILEAATESINNSGKWINIK